MRSKLFRFFLAAKYSTVSGCKNRLNLSIIQVNHLGELTKSLSSHTKTDFCLEHGFQVRDLRQLEPVTARSHSHSQPPCILSKGKSIFVSFLNLKAIIQERCVKFIDSPIISQQQQGETADAAFFGSLFVDLQEQIVTKQEIPFEFVVLECLLDHVSNLLSGRMTRLQEHINGLLSYLEKKEVDRGCLQQLLLSQKDLQRFQSVADAMRGSIEDLLHSNHDMKAMCLSKRESSEEIELLLEHFVRILDDVVDRSQDLLQNIQCTEAISNIVLDSQRNSLLRFELRLTLASFAMGMGGLGAGFFGMNLTSSLEKHPNAFLIAVGALSSISTIVLVSCWRKMDEVIRESQL